MKPKIKIEQSAGRFHKPVNRAENLKIFDKVAESLFEKKVISGSRWVFAPEFDFEPCIVRGNLKLDLPLRVESTSFGDNVEILVRLLPVISGEVIVPEPPELFVPGYHFLNELEEGKILNAGYSEGVLV